MTKYERCFRRTGRTTRMLEAVAEAAFGGQKVAVVYGHHGEKRNLSFMLQAILSKMPDGLAYLDRVKFIHVKDPMVDIEAPRMLRGYDCPVFVDHHAVEVKIGPRLLDMLHSWDEKGNP